MRQLVPGTMRKQVGSTAREISLGYGNQVCVSTCIHEFFALSFEFAIEGENDGTDCAYGSVNCLLYIGLLTLHTEEFRCSMDYTFEASTIMLVLVD